jgi:hypothetical protein
MHKASLKPFNKLLVATGSVLCAFTADAATFDGMYFSVNNSASGNYFWSSPITGPCSASAGECAEVGGGFVYLPPDYFDTAEENKRAMAEFDLTGLGSVASAMLSFEVVDEWGYFIQGCCVSANVVAYQGDNVASLSDWGATATSTVGSFWVDSPDTLNFDVTAAYNHAIQQGWSALGIRLQDPNVNVDNASRFGNFQLTTVVPLPAAAWLLAGGCLGLVGAAVRRPKVD